MESKTARLTKSGQDLACNLFTGFGLLPTRDNFRRRAIGLLWKRLIPKYILVLGQAVDRISTDTKAVTK